MCFNCLTQAHQSKKLNKTKPNQTKPNNLPGKGVQQVPSMAPHLRLLQHIAHRKQGRWQAVVGASIHSALPPITKMCWSGIFGKCAHLLLAHTAELALRSAAGRRWYLDGSPPATDLSLDGSLALCHRWIATFCTTRWPKQDAKKKKKEDTLLGSLGQPADLLLGLS